MTTFTLVQVGSTVAGSLAPGAEADTSRRANEAICIVVADTPSLQS